MKFNSSVLKLKRAGKIGKRGAKWVLRKQKPRYFVWLLRDRIWQEASLSVKSPHKISDKRERLKK